MATGSFFSKFFSPKEEVISHWYVPVDHFDYSSVDFYEKIEAALESRQVPGLDAKREEIREGGLLSDKRLYLRLKRERLVFDICAAPFGTSFFFSFRLVELPLGIKLIQLAVLFLGSLIFFGILCAILGITLACVLMFFLTLGGMFLMRNLVTLGLKDIDATLIKIPIIGTFYECFFRKETYYREDTRLMYLTTVETITQQVVDEVTASKGIKLIKRYERTPRGGKVYSENEHTPQLEETSGQSS